MCNINAISLLILYLSLDFAHLVNSNRSENSNKDWEFLIFTQHWPATVCKDWVHHNSSHSCIYPNKRNMWTIHGIWPSNSENLGPQFCNNTWLFDPEQVKPIENDLEQSWINIEKAFPMMLFPKHSLIPKHVGTGIYSLWAHEWSKHGTCAAAIESLNSEFKYFSKGLDLLKKYSMDDILKDANILPSDINSVTVDQLNEAIVSKTNKKPMIECKYEDHIQYLFELRICFDKEFNLIDCVKNSHGVPGFGLEQGVVTNCNVNAKIIYPEQQPARKGLVQLYKFINWLQWFTL